MPARFSEVEAEEKRREIMRSVSPVFAEKGYESTTVRDLESASGLSRGGIFFHFSSKRELYKSVLESCMREGGPAAVEAALAADTAQESMMGAFEAVQAWHGEHPEAWQFFQQIHVMMETNPDIAELDAGISEMMDTMIVGVVEELQRRHVYNPDLDPVATTHVLHAVMDHLTDHAREMEPEAAMEMARTTFAVVARGLDPAD